MVKSHKPESKSPERQEAPHGRETPVIGPRQALKKVRPLDGEPAIDRPYEPNGRHTADENPWQDPGGPEPANG
jgi:hypothetical protein